MKAWRDKLDKLLDGEYKLFEEDYKITYPCVLKRGRKRIKGRIDIDRIINLAAGIKVGYMNRRTLMLDKKLYSKTEGRLYRYFRDIEEIDKLENRCMELEKAEESLRQDIRNTNVSIDAELGMAIGYEERVQISTTGTSRAEQGIIKEIERMQREWKQTRKQILKNHARIREIQRQNADMNYLFRNMATEYKLIAEMKYKEKLSLERIGERVCIDKSNVKRKKDKIVRDASKFI